MDQYAALAKPPKQLVVMDVMHVQLGPSPENTWKSIGIPWYHMVSPSTP
jgi:hypothetical protein